MTRPGLDEIYQYRRAVDLAMEDFLGAITEAALTSVLSVIELGLNHEQQHQELILTDIKHALSRNPLHPAYHEEAPVLSTGQTRPMEWRTFPAGLQCIGHDGTGFSFDNEGPRHRVYLEEFQVGSRLVTNCEFREFVDDGGYNRPELWLSDGWNTVKTQRWSQPLYWERSEDSWWEMTLAGFRRLREQEPVCHVSFYEADAYARWAGARLATEAEWETAVAGQKLSGNFLESGRYHPCETHEDSGGKLAQCFGDVWEWTRSAYSPYPGSRPAAGALGEYNAKFMCNQIVLRGGSCATPVSHIRPSYRNFFPPDARWQFSGIRMAKDI